MEPVYTLLLLVAVPCSVLCGHVPAPDNITMNSRHFVHLLTWESGPGSPAGVYYRVTFRSYKEGWRTVESCAQVRYRLRCNLTDVFSDLYETYYINVTAVSGEDTSTPRSYRTPFRPVSDTEPEPPLLQLSPCNDSLCVNLQSPSQRLQRVYDKFYYTLNVTNEKGAQMLLKTKRLETVELKVVPGLQYCVTVNIDNQRPANKTPVCSSKPAAGNNMDALIPGVLGLTVLLVGLFVFLYILQKPVKTNLPSVLKLFNAPYKVQLLLPAAEFLKFDALEFDVHKNVQLNKETDHTEVVVEEEEEEEEDVVYESLGGCQDASCEEVLEETSSSLPGFPENQFESGTKTYIHRDASPHREATSQNTSPIFTTHSLALKMPILQLKKKDPASLWSTKGDRHRQEEEEEEESDVNFFSLTLESQNLVRQKDAEKREQMEDVKPEENVCVLETLKPFPDVQSASSANTSRHTSCSEEDEEGDTDEADAYSGYVMRN